MSEAEKQEGQKTVVAFITGLLIGGLLVWVFSSSPEAPANTDEQVADETAQVEGTNDSTEEAADTTSGEVVGDGSIVVADQAAGTSVTLGEVKYPTTKGWIAVRDLMDGMAGNVLGAARYDTEAGLLPTTVELQRPTTAGGTYLVVFYTEDGDNQFLLATDTLINGPETTFKAN